MKTTTSIEQTRKLIKLGLDYPPEVKNWIVGYLGGEFLNFVDDDNVIHVVHNYDIDTLTQKFIELSSDKKYSIVYDGEWKFSIDNSEDVSFNEYIDLLVYGIEKIMEG